MPVAITRRQLFKRGPVKPNMTLPPWALSYETYSNLCDGCGKCVGACPEQILFLNEDMLAVVRFENGYCDFCGDCETACPTNALNKESQVAWRHKATISAKCISTQGVVCRLCEEACDVRAIQFKLMLAGRALPLVDEDQCNGCGGCVSVCPASAVSLHIPITRELQS